MHNVVMREALARAGKTAVVKLAFHDAERLVLVYPHGPALALRALRWPEELLPTPPGPGRRVDINPAEAEAADALIDAIGPIPLSTLRDDHHAALARLVEEKTAGAPVGPVPKEVRPARTVDLMDALNEAAEQARRKRASTHQGDDD